MKVTKIIGNLFILTFCLTNKVCSMPAESNKVNSILWGHYLTSNQTPNQVPISIPYPLNYFIILGWGNEIGIWIVGLTWSRVMTYSRKSIFTDRLYTEKIYPNFQREGQRQTLLFIKWGRFFLCPWLLVCQFNFQKNLIRGQKKVFKKFLRVSVW